MFKRRKKAPEAANYTVRVRKMALNNQNWQWQVVDGRGKVVAEPERGMGSGDREQAIRNGERALAEIGDLLWSDAALSG